MRISDELSARFANMSFVCACLVVLLHVTATPDRGSVLWWVQSLVGADGIAKIAVPYFFFASGFFLARRVRYDGSWYGEAVVKRVRSLLLPFVLWNLIGWVFLLVVVGVAAANGFKTGLEIPACNHWLDAVALVGLHPLRMTAHPHTWFLRSLFVNVLLSPLLVPLVRRAKRWQVASMALALLVVNWVVVGLGSPGVVNFAKFIFSIEGFAYFAAGMLVCLNWERLQLSKPVSMVLAFTGWAIVAMRPILLLTISSYGGWGGWLLDYAGRALLIYAVWMVLPSHRIFGKLTDCSFALYMMHRFTLILCFGCLNVLGLKEVTLYSSVSLYFGRAMLSIAVICCLTMALRRLLPRIASLMFGGR